MADLNPDIPDLFEQAVAGNMPEAYQRQRLEFRDAVEADASTGIEYYAQS